MIDNFSQNLFGIRILIDRFLKNILKKFCKSCFTSQLAHDVERMSKRRFSNFSTSQKRPKDLLYRLGST
jgi:hypothetical protein